MLGPGRGQNTLASVSCWKLWLLVRVVNDNTAGDLGESLGASLSCLVYLSLSGIL